MIKLRECVSKNARLKHFTVSMSKRAWLAVKIVQTAQGPWFMIALLARQGWLNSRPQMGLYAIIISVKRGSIMTRGD